MSNGEVVAPLELPESLEKLDKATSPIHSPMGVCFCFNLIFMGVAASIAALFFLGSAGFPLYALAVSSLLLWAAINVMLFEVWKLSQASANQGEDSVPHEKDDRESKKLQ